jgi:sugar phosphate permease
MAFCTCVNIGNIIGAQLTAGLLRIFVWGDLFLLCAALFILEALIMMFYLVKEPKTIGIYIEDEEKPISLGGKAEEVDESILETFSDSEPDEEEKINFCKAWLLPNVLLYAAAFFLCKFAVYAVMFNLPTFL